MGFASHTGSHLWLHMSQTGVIYWLQFSGIDSVHDSLKSPRQCNYEAEVKNGPKAEGLLVLTIPCAKTGMLVID